MWNEMDEYDDEEAPTRGVLASIKLDERYENAMSGAPHRASV